MNTSRKNLKRLIKKYTYEVNVDCLLSNKFKLFDEK